MRSPGRDKTIYFFTFIFMKYIFALVVAILATTATASASTGTTLTCNTGLPCAGGPTRGFNHTTNSWEMVPQCFPWVFTSDYYKGNIFDMYNNQAICRAKRLKDFGL